ncbi:hypothetical protein NI18_05980 [Sphingomonas sp. Ant20]|nr:hypothetical protein NI18_05980 [Sphingomonas sp. Ant20]
MEWFMLETIIVALAGWMLLAASAFRYRRDLGITAPGTIRLLRIAAAAALTLAFLRCGAPVSGERVVRFLGGGSIAAVIMVARCRSRRCSFCGPSS